MKLIINTGTLTTLLVRNDKVELWQDRVLQDHFNDKEVADMVDFLTDFQNRPRLKYYLWRGSNGTIIGALTTQEDLPSITVGGGRKRERFEPISSAFIKDKFGMFKEVK